MPPEKPSRLRAMAGALGAFVALRTAAPAARGAEVPGPPP